MKILVRNIAKTTTEEKIQLLFKEHGSVQSCNLVLDKETGASKGFAFVEMPKVGEAKAAIKQLNGYKLAGNLLRVKKAEAKETSPAPVKTKEANSSCEKKAEMVDSKVVWGTAET